jgi:triacylglycerol lipase
MIVPARSSELPGARTTRKVPVALHRWMVTDPRVLDAVAEILRR